MPMTKKDFELIADILRRSRKAVKRAGGGPVGITLAQFDHTFLPMVAEEVAEHSGNPRFDRERFINAVMES